MMKKIFSIFIALTAVFSLSAKTLYLQPNNNWKTDNARFAVYAFTAEENEWYDLAKVEGETGIYSAVVDDAYPTVIFCRMNPATEENNWDNKWNQTQDMIIDAEKNQCNITDWNKGEWAVFTPSEVDPNKFYVTGDSALVVDAAKLTEDKAWDEKAIGSLKDTLELNLLADQDYLLKVVVAGEWKGFESLTDTAAGLVAVPSLGGEHNIGFKLKEAGKVQVIYNDKEFKLVGNFVVEEPVEPSLKDGFYLISKALEWEVANLKEELLFAKLDNEGKEYKLTATLTLGDKIKVVKVENDKAAKWYPDGEGTEFEITEEYTGEHEIYFQEEKKDDWAAFGGYFWMGKNPKPVEEKEIKLVPYMWANDGAQIAAWVWNKDKSVETFTAFFKPINDGSDTLAAKVNVEADSIIFVRFSDKATEPKWNGGDGYQWNQTPNDSIQWESSVFTIIGCSGYNCNGTWERYIPEPPAKYYIVGDSAIVGSKEKEWQPDGLKSMTDTTILNLQPGKFSMRLTLEGTWEGPQRDYRHLTDTAKGLVEYVDDYLNHNITFELKEAGQVKVVFITAKDEEPEVFELIGNFFVPEPEPQPEKETLLLVPYKWTEGDAKIAAWIWGKKLDGHWTEYFAPIAEDNDTLKVEIEETADSIIFVRFGNEATDPTWEGGDGYIWDLMPNDTIDHVGLTFTVVDWRKGTWDVYVPVEPVVIEDGYYLNGTIVDWDIAKLAPFKFEENPGKEGEYLVKNVELKVGDEIKACFVENNAIDPATGWFGVGEANSNFTVTDKEVGIRTIYFNPSRPTEWDGYIYIEVETTALDNTQATVKAVKTLENGMLVIIKNGVRYNVIGQSIR